MVLEKRKTVCPLDCPDACSVIATLRNGEITKLDGDPDHPFTQGFLCKKFSTYHHRAQSPERVLYPQRRIGKKGEGKFVRISWEEAWQTLIHELTTIKNKYGGEALLPYTYAGNMGLLNRFAGEPFFYKYGASQLLKTICCAAADAGWNLHYGTGPSSPPEKALNADLIIAWGINVKVTNIHFMPFVVKARRQGARFVVIDPYLNATAQSADLYYPVKPGGDVALALGLLKILLEKDAVDHAFIAHHTEGFDELSSYAQQLPLEKTARDSGLDESQIRDLAGMLANNPKTFIRIGIGLTRNTQGAMSVRAIACLSAALGLFDGESGRGALLSSNAFSLKPDYLNYQALRETPTRKVNMVQLGDALTRLRPPLKGLFVYNSNPLSVAPDASRVRVGMAREDLFTIVHEQFVTPTARYADLLLPATTSFENSDLYTGYGHFFMQRVAPVISEKGEALGNFELFQTLARKMGYGDPLFQHGVDERISIIVNSMRGVSDERKKSGLLPGEALPSQMTEAGGNFSKFEGKRFRFAVNSADPAVPRIPSLQPKKEFDDFSLSNLYPFQMITPPMIDLLNSTFGERYKNETGTVLIHPRDAKSCAIEDGVMVEVFNGRGSNIRKAVVSEKTQPGLLVLEGIYWESEASRMSSINELTSQNTTDLGGGGTFHEARVNVRALES